MPARRPRRFTVVAPLRDRRALLALDVGDAEAAADTELVDAGRRRTRSASTATSCLEAVGAKDLAADVGVEADEVDGQARSRVDRVGGRTAGEREPELRVLLAGHDVLVGVRLDARRDPDQHPRAHAGTGRPAARRAGRSRRSCRR